MIINSEHDEKQERVVSRLSLDDVSGDYDHVIDQPLYHFRSCGGFGMLPVCLWRDVEDLRDPNNTSSRSSVYEILQLLGSLLLDINDSKLSLHATLCNVFQRESSDANLELIRDGAVSIGQSFISILLNVLVARPANNSSEQIWNLYRSSVRVSIFLICHLLCFRKNSKSMFEDRETFIACDGLTKISECFDLMELGLNFAQNASASFTINGLTSFMNSVLLILHVITDINKSLLRSFFRDSSIKAVMDHLFYLKKSLDLSDGPNKSLIVSCLENTLSALYHIINATISDGIVRKCTDDYLSLIASFLLLHLDCEVLAIKALHVVSLLCESDLVRKRLLSLDKLKIISLDHVICILCLTSRFATDYPVLSEVKSFSKGDLSPFNFVLPLRTARESFGLEILVISCLQIHLQTRDGISLLQRFRVTHELVEFEAANIVVKELISCAKRSASASLNSLSEETVELMSAVFSTMAILLQFERSFNIAAKESSTSPFGLFSSMLLRNSKSLFSVMVALLSASTPSSLFIGQYVAQFLREFCDSLLIYFPKNENGIYIILLLYLS